MPPLSILIIADCVITHYDAMVIDAGPLLIAAAATLMMPPAFHASHWPVSADIDSHIFTFTHAAHIASPAFILLPIARFLSPLPYYDNTLSLHCHWYCHYWLLAKCYQLGYWYTIAIDFRHKIADITYYDIGCHTMALVDIDNCHYWLGHMMLMPLLRLFSFTALLHYYSPPLLDALFFFSRFHAPCHATPHFQSLATPLRHWYYAYYITLIYYMRPLSLAITTPLITP